MLGRWGPLLLNIAREAAATSQFYPAWSGWAASGKEKMGLREVSLERRWPVRVRLPGELWVQMVGGVAFEELCTVFEERE